MKPEDERQVTADREMTVMFMGSGKSRTAGLMAYWRMMQTPVEGEDEPGGPADERFTPVSDEELERRLAELNDLVVEPLPEEIEELSDSSRFLDPVGETKEPDEATTADPHHAFSPSPRRGLRLAIASSASREDEAGQGLATWKRHADAGLTDHWAEFQRAFSTVLYVGYSQVGTRARKRRTESPFSDLLFRRAMWDDMLKEWERASERKRQEVTHYSTPSWSWALIRPDQPLRDAVRNVYFTHRYSVTVCVDNMGAARDPNAALTSLIADATTFCATTTDDGAWTLLAAAPAVDSDACLAPSPPRLAVMELPGAPPRLDSARPPTNEPDLALLRRLINALEGL
ncbi:hypothetical protein [Streptomyces sp. NPDC052015]|uniref:hypothetical protein n=1 Tax=Streptomyces sp. NPDC052015 TaxID=3154755 RepID=UPI00343051DC